MLPTSTRVFESVADLGVPRIHFGVGTGELLGLMAEAGADVVGVDWRVPLAAARQRVGPGNKKPRPQLGRGLTRGSTQVQPCGPFPDDGARQQLSCGR